MVRGLRAPAGALAMVAAVLLAGCGAAPGSDDPTPASSGTRGASPGSKAPAHAVPVSEVEMSKPDKLEGGTASADIMVSGERTLSTKTVDRVRAVTGVARVDEMAVAQFYREEQQLTYAAVDPATFRRFTPASTALTQQVWNRVAGGEMALRPELKKDVQDAKGYVAMGNDADAPKAHVGAYAPLLSRASGQPVLDAVVNERWVDRLGMTKDNAMLVSTGSAAPRAVAKKIQGIVGKKTTVQILAVDLDVNAVQTAVVTGGSVSSAIGSLRYTPIGGGRVRPDPAWVATYIRTEEVPILGTVTCNKVMLPSLRAVMTEIVQRGLADKIHPGEYGGCYVPRFIAGSTSLSFHTFGTALDVNVPGNLRGTVGQIDRQVVEIFKRWGFGWGGDWRYTDPMHFELHEIRTPK